MNETPNAEDERWLRHGIERSLHVRDRGRHRIVATCPFLEKQAASPQRGFRVRP